LSTIPLLIALFISFSSAQEASSRPVSFGTKLDAKTVISEAQKLAASLTSTSSPTWRAKGDQHRSYRFPAANADEPYRLIVPESWDGTSKLPLVMFLHGAGSNESTYLDQNNKQMIKLANEHGFILVAPLGDKGAYGNFLRLSAQFGNEAGAATLMAQVTDASEKTNSLSEQDVINVLELVLHEYPVDRGAVFLTGHSMGSGGTWYIGGKYATYWSAIAPMSGPFVQESGYPWDSIKNTPVFVTEGIQTPSIDGSRAVRDWMKKQGLKITYKEVDADHGGMIPLVLPDVFSFFDTSRIATVSVTAPLHKESDILQRNTGSALYCQQNLTIRFTRQFHDPRSRVALYDLRGRCVFTSAAPVTGGTMVVHNVRLSVGVYRITCTAQNQHITVRVGTIR